MAHRLVPAPNAANGETMDSLLLPQRYLSTKKGGLRDLDDTDDPILGHPAVALEVDDPADELWPLPPSARMFAEPRVTARIYAFAGYLLTFAHRRVSHAYGETLRRGPLDVVCGPAMDRELAFFCERAVEKLARAKPNGLGRVRELDLRASFTMAHVERVALRVLRSEQLTSLEQLALRVGADAGDAGVKMAFGALARPGVAPRLRALRVDGGHVGEDGVALLCSALASGGFAAHLETLSLARNHARALGARALASLLAQRPWPALRALGVARNQIGDGFAPLAKALAKSCPNLEELDAAENALGPDAALELGRALGRGQLARLAVLDARDNPGVGDAGVAAVFEQLADEADRYAARREAANRPAARRIARLELSHAEAADLTMGALARAMRARALARLVALDVSFNGVQARGFGALARALGNRCCPELEELNVSNNFVGDAGVNELCQAIVQRGLRRLRFLDVSTNNARASIFHLANILSHGPCPRLRVLVIHGATPVDDKSERHFRRVPGLKTVR